jgi:hypothetical protein
MSKKCPPPLLTIPPPSARLAVKLVGGVPTNQTLSNEGVIMKRADVVIAGLVMLGVFGLVFAGQMVSQVGFSSQNGDGMAVGSCPGNRDIADATFCRDVPATTSCAGFGTLTGARTCPGCRRALERHDGCPVPDGQDIAGQISPGCSSSSGVKVGGAEGVAYNKVTAACPSITGTVCKNATSQPECPDRSCRRTFTLFECLPDGIPTSIRCGKKEEDPSVIDRHPEC